jgi:hypothetical protein
MMSNRFERIAAKSFQYCLLYSDLRETFGESGKTKGFIMFSPVLKSSDQLSSRSIVADDRGIYLIGGTQLANHSAKSFFAPSNKCSFYDITTLEHLINENKRREMDSMQLKRSDLTIAQTRKLIIVGNRTSWNELKGKACNQFELELFDKQHFVWLPTIFRYDIFNLKIPGYVSLNFKADADGKEENLYVLLQGNNIQARSYILSVDQEENCDDTSLKLVKKELLYNLYEDNSFVPYTLKGN